MSSHEQAEKKHGGVVRIALNLTAACLISGVILAAVFYFTNPIAKEKSAEMLNESMRSLVPDADAFKAVSGHSGWYTAMKDGKTVAYVVPSVSSGYGGDIDMLVAVDTQGKVLNMTVTSSNETPGLGDRATKSSFTDQFKGKTASHLTVVKDTSDKDDIQAITGSTISSKAVTAGVKTAVEEVGKLLGGKTQ